MKHKLKTLALATVMASSAYAAAPNFQTCNPMELRHSGGLELSYQLNCSAGEWALQYVGSVPAGTASVKAQYRLRANHPDGSQFALNRSTNLPTAAYLGQALLREAVILGNGKLALRDCEDFNCSVYRPLGGDSAATKATALTPKESPRAEDFDKLRSELSQREEILGIQAKRVTALEQAVAALQKKLAQSEAKEAKTSEDFSLARDDYDAELLKLRNAHAATQTPSAEVRAEQGKAREQAQACAPKTEVVPVLPTEAQASESPLAERQAALNALRSNLVAAKRHLASAKEKYSQRNAAFKTLAEDTPSAEVAAARMKLDGSAGQVRQAQKQVLDLERAVRGAAAELSKLKDQLSRASSQSQPAVNADRQTLLKQLDASQKEVASLQVTVSDLPDLAQATTHSEKHSESGLTDKLRETRKELAEAQSKGASSDVAAKALQEQLSSALADNKQLATRTLEFLDKYDALSAEKTTLESALVKSDLRIETLSAKLRAAELGRDLARQAATTAHADADAQNLKVQSLSAKLTTGAETTSQDGVRKLIRERDALGLAVERQRADIIALSATVEAQQTEIAQLKQQVALQPAGAK